MAERKITYPAADARPSHLTLRQQRAALEMLARLARGEQTVLVFRWTREGRLQECAEEVFVGR